MSSPTERRCFLVSKDVVVPLTTQQPVVLGRDPTASNFVLSDDRVSRVHSMIVFREGQFFVKDLNSSNGTFLNGRRVMGSVPLKAGDRIGIAPFSLEFVQPQYAAAESADSGLADGRNKFEGSIVTLPITDLIQLLNATQQSGVLTVTDPADKQADVVFVEGEIDQAHYDGKTGEAAVYALMRARRGRFEFTKLDRSPIQDRIRQQPGQAEAPVGQTLGGEPQIVRRTQSLLLEGARLMDEEQDPDAAHRNADGATTRDSSCAPDLSSLGNVVD